MSPICGYNRSGSLLLPGLSLRPRVASSLRFCQPAHGATLAEHRVPHRLGAVPGKPFEIRRKTMVFAGDFAKNPWKKHGLRGGETS